MKLLLYIKFNMNEIINYVCYCDLNFKMIFKLYDPS